MYTKRNSIALEIYINYVSILQVTNTVHVFRSCEIQNSCIRIVRTRTTAC